jgi:integrase
MSETEPDWSEAPLSRWLSEIRKDSTKSVYKSAYRLFHNFTGMTSTQIIREALEDNKLDGLDKKGIVLKRLLEFNTWLLEEVPRKRTIGKGLSPKISNTYTQAIRSFYGTFEIYVKLTKKSALPNPRVLNKRIELDQRDMQKLLSHIKSPRDRAILLTIFQGGLDVSTLCNLTYGDVSKGLESGEYPLKLDLFRGKSGTEFYTFLGRDAIDSIKAYLNDVRGAGVEFSAKTPLFLKANYKTLAAVSDNNLQDMLRELAVRAMFVDKEMNGYSQNPLGPHSLRESFSKICTNKAKIPNNVVDFWLGHSLGQLAKAYMASDKVEDLKKLYLEAEQFLSVSGGVPIDVEKLKKEIKEEARGDAEKIQKRLDRTIDENFSLKDRLDKLEGEQIVQRDLLEVMEARWKELKQEIMEDKELDGDIKDRKGLTEEEMENATQRTPPKE